jgi:hypothetical protein
MFFRWCMCPTCARCVWCCQPRALHCRGRCAAVVAKAFPHLLPSASLRASPAVQCPRSPLPLLPPPPLPRRRGSCVGVPVRSCGAVFPPCDPSLGLRVRARAPTREPAQTQVLEQLAVPDSAGLPQYIVAVDAARSTLAEVASAVSKGLGPGPVAFTAADAGAPVHPLLLVREHVDSTADPLLACMHAVLACAWRGLGASRCWVYLWL